MNRESERKRLVELLDNFNQEEFGINLKISILEKYADHILADGWMRPPVKVGETVYHINDTLKLVDESTVYAYTFNNGGLALYVRSGIFSAVITEWYLTREEAEAKLKGEGK